jgi:hypothetical protein
VIRPDQQAEWVGEFRTVIEAKVHVPRVAGDVHDAVVPVGGRGVGQRHRVGGVPHVFVSVGHHCEDASAQRNGELENDSWIRGGELDELVGNRSGHGGRAYGG